MPKITATETTKDAASQNRTAVYSATLAAGDWVKPLVLPFAADKTVQATGVFGTSGALSVYWSNQDSDLDLSPSDAGNGWILAKSVADQANIVLTAKGGAVMVENPLYMTAMASGDGTTAINFSVAATRVGSR